MIAKRTRTLGARMDSVEGMISDLQNEQERTTENMVEMQNQNESLLKIAVELKAETMLIRDLPETVNIEAMFYEYLKQKTAKRFAMFFTGLGQITSILLLGALGAAVVKLVFGL